MKFDVVVVFAGLLVAVATDGNVTDSGPAVAGSYDEKDRASVKKELRESVRWAGSGLAEEEDAEPIRGIYLDEVARQMTSFLRRVSNEELGVTKLQSVYDSLPFGVLDLDDSQRVAELADRLQGKLNHYLSLLNQSKASTEELYWHHLHRPLSSPIACCDIPDSIMRYSNRFWALISEDVACDVTVVERSPAVFMPGHNLTDVFSNNLKLAPSIKWQYFIGPDRGLAEYPSHHFDSKSGSCSSRTHGTSRRRALFLSAVYPQLKSIILVIDHGSALSPNQLSIGKSIGKYIISTLSHQDQVGVIALADEPHYSTSADCVSRGLVAATHETKTRLYQFIEGLSKAKAPANHVLGIRHALDMARRAMLSSGSSAAAAPPSTADQGCSAVANKTCAWPSVGDCPMDMKGQVLIVYISRGLLSSLAEPRQVMELIALGQMCLQGKLVINTYALIDDGKPIMYEKAFLQDMAVQNYSRYNVSFLPLDKLSVARGQALSVNSSRGIAATLGNYLSVLNATSSGGGGGSSNSGAGSDMKPHFSSPYWDPVGKGLVVSVTQPCFHLDTLIGAVGMDLHVADLAEDATYFQQPGGRSYAFVTDRRGITLMHPALARPNTVMSEPIQSDIGLLESWRPGFEDVRRAILSTPSGSRRLLAQDSATPAVTFTWQSSRGSPFIVCIVTREKVGGGVDARVLKRVTTTPSAADLVYHRLDVVSSPAKVGLCRYFGTHATLDAGSLYLSPGSYLSPFKFESWAAEQSSGVVQSFMTFLTDKTKLIANPGLRSSVRSDVSAVSQMVAYWKGLVDSSPLGQYVVRRYVASPAGVMVEYPASRRQSSFDPSRRPWFQKAIEFPGRVVVTGPTLDPAGSGYVVSVSHTVYEGKAAALHGPSDDVVAVVGADFTMSYLHRFLWQMLPFCPDRSGSMVNTNIRCFLMDERGYLLAHPNLLEPELSVGGVEAQHLTHHEPLVASDLLNHESFVVKKSCNSLHDRTVQRYYQLNLTLAAGLAERASGGPDSARVAIPVLTNLVHGEHCIRYQIVAVPGTNLFAGIVNQTCETATAFCPCSTVDRLCLNCHRMEQSECECPCECPLELESGCSATAAGLKSDGLATCPAQSEVAAGADRSYSSSSSRGLESLPSCLALDCEQRITERECFGVVGCEWCVRESDGVTPLQVAFCTRQNKCHAGVLHGPSPYSDGSSMMGASGADVLSFKSMPVGPVAGGILTFFFLVALSVYCYRQHSERRRRHGVSAYSVGGGAGGLRMSQLDNELDRDADDTTAVVSRELGLAGVDNVAIVSPYRVNTSYRRPAGGDSDHGYSTMTPHEDSEHTTSYVEPLLVSRDRYRPAVRSLSGGSFSSRASSPLGPVYMRVNPARIDSPATLHESADELEMSNRQSDHPAVWSKVAVDADSPIDPAVIMKQQRLAPPTTFDHLPTGMTILADHRPNQMIVPVTVHMVDTS